MKNYAVIRVKPETKDKADKLIKKYGKTGIKFYDAVMDYLLKSKLNPFEYNEASLSKEVQLLRQDIARTLKKDHKAMFSIMGRFEKLTIKYLDYIENHAPSKNDLTSVSTLKLYEQELKIKELQNSLLKISNSGKIEKQSFSTKEKIVLEMPQQEFQELIKKATD